MSVKAIPFLLLVSQMVHGLTDHMAVISDIKHSLAQSGLAILH